MEQIVLDALAQVIGYVIALVIMYLVAEKILKNECKRFINRFEKMLENVTISQKNIDHK